MRRVACLPILLLAAVLGACGEGSGAADGPPAGAVTVRMLYGSEKQSWIEAVTAQFNAAGNKTPEGKPIYVEAVPMGSGDSMERILSGEDQATVWSPASGILLPVANARWGAANGGKALVGDAPPLVLSPVVVAMWEPMAKALGWPEKPIGWGDIAELARSGKTWADYGHPEWGPFQFGHTHPDYSNSGITAVLAQAYAAAGKTRGLTVADAQSPATAALLDGVAQSVIHYGESTGFFGRQMLSRGPSYLSAAVLYENLVIESHDKSRYPDLALPVVAIYPKEGTFWSDHPYAILDAPWVTPEQQAGAKVYRDFLLAQPQQQKALELGFRPSDINIPLGAPIVSENGIDPKQPQTLLEVPPAEVTEAVIAAWGQHKKRVEVAVVIDVSGSMEDDGRLNKAKAALATFLGQLSDEDYVSVTAFSDAASELSPMGALGPKRQQLIGQVEGLFANGGTRLLDTTSEVYTALQSEPPGERIRAIVVLTDGLDTKSTRSGDEVAAQLAVDKEGRSIKVFTIAFGGDADRDLLKRLAESSGARSYAGDSGELDIVRVYREIATFF